jgi:very-short-patch-repair endonuclease
LNTLGWGLFRLDGPDCLLRNRDEERADRALEAAGYRVLHVTEREFTEEPDRIAALLRRELKAGESDKATSPQS